MNSLNFTANLGGDAETRFMANGDTVTSFSAALSSGYGDKKITSWLSCSMYGKRGESVAPYLKKGTQVAIIGEFCARPYTTKDGVEKLSLNVRVNDLTLLGNRENQHKTETPLAPYNINPADPMADLISDIPF